MVPRMPRRSAVAVIVTTSSLVLALTACSSSKSNAGSSPSSSSSAGSSSHANGKHLTIGASVLGMQFPAVVALVKGMKDEAAALGVKLVVDDANGQAAKQTNDMADLVNQKVDGIIVNALDSKAIVSSVQTALAKKIPVASAFTTLGTAKCAYDGTVAHVGFDEQGWAKLEGNEALKLLPNGGDVAIIDGAAGLQSSKIRHDVFVQTIASNPKIKLVASQPGNFDRTTANTAMTNILQAQSKLKLVYAPDDNMAVGAIQAIRAANRSGIDVLGIGGSKDGLKAVQDGTMVSTVYSSLEQGGKQVVQAMVEHLKGTDSKMGQCVAVPQTLVTKANIAQFIDKGEY